MISSRGPGSRIGPYVIERELGRGGMAALARIRAGTPKAFPDNDPWLEKALLRGLAAARASVAKKGSWVDLVVAVDDMASAKTPIGPELRAELAAVVVEGAKAELGQKKGDEAVRLLVAAGKLGLRFADARTGDQLLDRFYNERNTASLQKVSDQTWAEVLTAFARMDVDIDQAHLSSRTLAVSRADPAARYVRAAATLVIGDSEKRAKAMRELEDLERSTALGPRTRAHILEYRANDPSVTNRQTEEILRAARELDPESPERVFRLGRHYKLLGKKQQALECLLEARRRFEKIGPRSSTAGDEQMCRDFIADLERDGK